MLTGCPGLCGGTWCPCALPLLLTCLGCVCGVCKEVFCKVETYNQLVMVGVLVC